MPQFLLRSGESVDPNEENRQIESIRPLLNHICYNSIRAGIIYILIQAKDLNHSMSVEEISKKMGKRHSVIIHHLEKLKNWNIIDIVRTSPWGLKEKRKIWGLNLKMPNLVLMVYSHMLKNFYTVKELEQITNVNKNPRLSSKS